MALLPVDLEEKLAELPDDERAIIHQWAVHKYVQQGTALNQQPMPEKLQELLK